MRTYVKFTYICAVLSTLFFVSCGNKEKKTSENTIIKVVVPGSGSRIFPRWFEMVAERYKVDHPNIDVVVEEVVSTQGDYFTKLALMLQADKGIDVVFEDSFMVKADAAAGYLSPLNVEGWADWDAQYTEPFQKAGMWRGDVYYIPVTTDVRGLFYNMQLFKKLGLPEEWNPRSWDDILDTARTIKARASEDVVPFYLHSTKASEEGTTMQGLQMLLYGTEDAMYENEKWVVTSQGLLDSLSFYNTVYREELGAPISLIFNPSGASELFDNMVPKDKVAIILDGIWIPNGWRKWERNWRDVMKFIPMPTQHGQAPGFTSMSGGWGLSMSSLSQHKDLTMDFIMFASQKENVLELAFLSNDMLARMDVANDEEYLKIGVLSTASSFLPFTHFRPINEEYPAVSMEARIAVEAVAVGELSPEDAMKEYAKNVRRTVGDDKVVEKYSGRN